MNRCPAIWRLTRSICWPSFIPSSCPFELFIAIALKLILSSRLPCKIEMPRISYSSYQDSSIVLSSIRWNHRFLLFNARIYHSNHRDVGIATWIMAFSCKKQHFSSWFRLLISTETSSLALHTSKLERYHQPIWTPKACYWILFPESIFRRLHSLCYWEAFLPPPKLPWLPIVPCQLLKLFLQSKGTYLAVRQRVSH